MFRTIYRAVLGPDRTRRVDGLPLRSRVAGYVLLVVYGFVWAVVGSVQITQRQDPDGWWPLVFALTLAPFLLLWWSPLYAWRLGVVGFYVIGVLVRWDDVADFQLWSMAPILLVVVALYSRGIVITVVLVSAALLTGFNNGTAALIVLGVMAAIYFFGAQGRAEEQLERERDEKAALQERARIAREMHDVVAHHMSMVVVRCETAPYRLKGLNEEAQQEFQELGEAARGAITDMQRLLGVLRANGQEAELEPQPGISRIAELARPGDEAEIAVDDVPEAIGLTAYRIVQEALTNATRHAPGSKASVHVHTKDNTLDVVVINTAGGPSRGGGSGQGLNGMRERVAVHGGTLTVKATDSGGFLVRARIPLGDK